MKTSMHKAVSMYKRIKTGSNLVQFVLLNSRRWLMILLVLLVGDRLCLPFCKSLHTSVLNVKLGVPVQYIKKL